MTTELKFTVLILILMEYALWGWWQWRYGSDWRVLILILMEYALWGYRPRTFWKRLSCLNPYSNGICSMRLLTKDQNMISEVGLNPYSNGICSMSAVQAHACTCVFLVLILILMEYALWEFTAFFYPSMTCLNPYSNGICSMRKVSKPGSMNDGKS